MALLYDLLGSGESAVQHYRTCVEIEPENRMSTNNLAVAVMAHKEDYTVPESILLKNLERHRFDRTTIHNLAYLYRKQGKGFQALKFYTYLGELLERSLMEYETEKWEDHATALFEKRRYPDAIPVFENLALEKQDIYWLEKLAVIYTTDEVDAQDIADEVARFAPDGEPIVAQLGPVVGNHLGPGTLGLCLIRANSD